MLIPAHEVMHGFGGALFGYGAVISLNGADPSEHLESTGQWVVFALSGTAYLFYVTALLLVEYRRWRRPYLLGSALAAGTVHQWGFFMNLMEVLAKGTIEGRPSDPFHAGAILWNGGPLNGAGLPWREITLTLGWPSFLIISVLAISLLVWLWIGWHLTGVATNDKARWLRRSSVRCISGLLVILISATLIVSVYAIFAAFVYLATDLKWSGSQTQILVLGFLLIIAPLAISGYETVLGPRRQYHAAGLPGPDGGG